MGDNADMILDGVLCEETGEYIGPGAGYPRKARFVEDTQVESKIRAIRKELAILIKSKQELCSTDKERNKAVNEARYEINSKYGRDWREKN